jgi:hypothetical protein
LKFQAMFLRAGTFLLGGTAALAQNLPTIQVQCTSPQSNGGLIATFTYLNTTGNTIIAANGSSNNYSPATVSPSNPPTQFNTGSGSFSVTTNAPSVTWTLGSQHVTADSTAPSCASFLQWNLSYAIFCWDQNANGVCDPSEDVNHDGVCNILDCPGAAGPLGAPGPTGATGPTGPQGAAASTTFRLASTVSTTATASVTCLATETLISGGGACSVAGSNRIQGRIGNSLTPDMTSWQVVCDNGTATAMAICGKK